MVKGSQHEQNNERTEAEKIKSINDLYQRDEPESDNINIMVANQGKIDKKNTKFKVRSNQLGEGHDIYGNSDNERGNTERGSATEEQKEVDEETAQGSNLNDY